MENVWVVTYYDIGEDPVVKVFDNCDAAIECHVYYLGEYDRVSIDAVPVCSSF